MVDWSIEAAVAGLGMPVLVVRGGLDPIAGTDFCRRLRDRAPRGGLVVVPGRHHHLVQVTAPRAVASAVRALEAIVASNEAARIRPPTEAAVGATPEESR